MSLLTRLSLANRAIVALLSLVIVGVGLWATGTIKQELLPSIDQPTAVVVVTQPGASSATLDTQVVVPLSQALAAVDGVDEVRSSVSSGVAQLTVMWSFGADSTAILNEVKAATASSLGTEARDVNSEIFAGSSSDIPVVSLAFTSDSTAAELAERLDDALVPAIRNIPGVRDVQVAGRSLQRVLVTIDPATLEKHSIDRSMVSASLQAAGVVVPAGTSVDGDQALAIEVGSENTSLADLQALPIPTLAGPVVLSSVAQVELVPVAQSSLSRADGRPSVGLTITKNPDANAVHISRAVSEAVDLNIAKLGAGAAVHTIFDQSVMVEQSIHDLSVEGGLGLLFAVLIILIFLLSPRATLITAISIPLSLLIAIIGLRLGGFSLNIFTLAALTVAVGRVVDDSIVVIENITRRRGEGELTLRDVRASVAQVAGAVTASTLTTVAVFLPVAFVGGVAGELFRPFAVTVAVALLASLLVSLTIVPVLAYWFMHKPSKSSLTSAAAQGAERTTKMQRAYKPALLFALRRPVAMIIISAVVFAGTLLAAGFLKTDLLGSFADDRIVLVQQSMPLTSTVSAADAAAVKLEKAVARVDDVASYQTTVSGQGTPVRLDLLLTPEANPETALERIRKAVSAVARSEDITVSNQETQTTSSTIDVIITGTNEESLVRASELITSRLGKLPEVSTVTTDLAELQPVLSVDVDPVAAATHGYSVAEVGSEIAAAVEGQILGSASVDSTSYDLVLRSQTTETDPDAIRALTLPVTALQQQLTQKAAVDALNAQQQRSADNASAEARRELSNQLSSLITSRQESARDLAALRKELARVIANPPPASGDPVTEGQLGALEHQKLVSQLSGALSGTEEGLSALDEQITSVRTALSDAATQQAEAERFAQAQKDIEKLRGTPISVGDIATVEAVDSPATVTRIDGVRAVTVSATPETDDLGAASVAVTTVIEALDLPDGVSLDHGGVAEEQSESFTQLALAMLIAIALVYILLVATFRSLVQPLLLLVSVPLAATGAIGGLLITGTPLGIPAMIGMLMLIGIVVTNAIVLIDLINEYRRSGSSIDDAVVHGARLRLRPIIMTACATIFALLPMAFGLTGGGAFISKSLAIVVIGGLVSSTVLTLLLLPSLYVIHERRLERRKSRRSSDSGSSDAPADGGINEPLPSHDKAVTPQMPHMKD